MPPPRACSFSNAFRIFSVSINTASPVSAYSPAAASLAIFYLRRGWQHAIFEVLVQNLEYFCVFSKWVEPIAAVVLVKTIQFGDELHVGVFGAEPADQPVIAPRRHHNDWHASPKHTGGNGGVEGPLAVHCSPQPDISGPLEWGLTWDGPVSAGIYATILVGYKTSDGPIHYSKLDQLLRLVRRPEQV
ncbi:hypothetical protein PG988_007592 [Apiospora saccharicola]